MRLPRALAAGLLVLAGAVLLAVAGGGLWLVLARAAPPTVRTAAARPASQAADGGSVLDASGYVTARRQATVSAKITGKVTEVLIEEGMRVEEGDVLARLDDTEAKAQLALARAQLAAARSQLAEIRAQLDQAERDYEPASRSSPARSSSPRRRWTPRGPSATCCGPGWPRRGAGPVAQESVAVAAGAARQHGDPRARSPAWSSPSRPSRAR